MFENIRLLYRHYGAGGGIWRSPYFWIAICLALGLGVVFGFESWYTIAHNTLPSLTGFSIAAFAIIFVVLRPDQISALLKSKNEKDKPPLLSVASIICHAILVQVLTITLAGVAVLSDYKEIISFCCSNDSSNNCLMVLNYLKWGFNCLGYFLLFYSWLLVLAAALSVLRMMALAGGVR